MPLIGIMKKKMGATIMGLYRVKGLGILYYTPYNGESNGKEHGQKKMETVVI